MRRLLILSLLAGINVAAAGPVPKGATVGRLGFATIRRVPPSPTGDVVSQRPTYNGPSEWYAQENKLSLAEATKRLIEQHALMPSFERLRVRLAASEPDNYVDAQIVH